MDQLKEKVAQELQRQSVAWQEKLSEQRSAAEEELVALKAEKADELQQQRAAWERKLCEVSSAADEQRAAFEARLEEVQSTAAAENNNLQTELESEKEDLLAEQVEAVARLTMALEEDQHQKERLHEQVAGSESALAEAQQERESLAAEVAKLKTSLAASKQHRAEQKKSLREATRQNRRWQVYAKTCTYDVCAEMWRHSKAGKRLAAMRELPLISVANDAPCPQLPGPAAIPAVTETGAPTCSHIFILPDLKFHCQD